MCLPCNVLTFSAKSSTQQRVVAVSHNDNQTQLLLLAFKYFKPETAFDLSIKLRDISARFSISLGLLLDTGLPSWRSYQFSYTRNILFVLTVCSCPLTTFRSVEFILPILCTELTVWKFFTILLCPMPFWQTNLIKQVFLAREWHV